jgi:hypothetical protein
MPPGQLPRGDALSERLDRASGCKRASAAAPERESDAGPARNDSDVVCGQGHRPLSDRPSKASGDSDGAPPRVLSRVT